MGFFLVISLFLLCVLMGCCGLRPGPRKTVIIYVIGFLLGFVPGLMFYDPSNDRDDGPPSFIWSLLGPLLFGGATLLIVLVGDVLSRTRKSKRRS